MQIGSFGNIVFETSAEKIRTFTGLQRTGAARYAQHAVQGAKQVLQFLGPSLDRIEFSIRLDAALGIKPLDEITALREVKDNGASQALVIGGKSLGNFVLTDLSENWKVVDGRGVLLLAEASLKLLEDADGT